jgi:hypothetical protein
VVFRAEVGKGGGKSSKGRHNEEERTAQGRVKLGAVAVMVKRHGESLPEGNTVMVGATEEVVSTFRGSAAG